MNRRAFVGAVLGLGVVAVITALVARREPDWSLAGDSMLWLTVELFAALALAAAGIAMRMRGPARRSGVLLLAAAAAWLVPEWNNPGAFSGIVFTAGLVLSEAAPPLVAHALLAHDRSKIGARLRPAAIGAGYGALVLTGGLGAALVTDPALHGCAACPTNLVRVADHPGWALDLQRWGLRLGIAALVIAFVLAALSMVRASPAWRGTFAPVFLPGVVYLGIVLARYSHALTHGWPGNDSIERSLRLAEALALLSVAVGVGWLRLSVRRMRHRLARIVIQVGQTPRPGELRTLLADAIGDQTLELLYAVDGRWIDATGAEQPLPGEESRAVTSLVQDRDVVAVVVHRRGVLDDLRLVEELGRAARLALDHDRLQAQLHRRLTQLRETRINVVNASDRERQRLERDLHDEAQQGLASLAMAIGLARAGSDHTSSSALARAQADVRKSLDEVRAIAHGIYPTALSDAGLAAALDVLAEWSPNLQNAQITDERFDPVIESTAYFIVDYLARQRATPVTANLMHEEHTLVVEVTTPETPELSAIEDRVGALDGRLQVLSETERKTTIVRVELPCV